MSNNGIVAGRGEAARYGDPDWGYRGIVWTPGNTYVISPPAGNRDAHIRGINDAGRAVGQTYDRLWNGPREFAFVWQQGVVTDLNTLVPDQLGLVWAARGTNNRGQIFAGGAHGRYLFTPVWLPGDLTGDCHVSVEDLILVLSNFGQPHGSFPRGDVDGDGAVDLSDLAILLAHWGE
ncbi:MAG: hypothetical protein HZB38_17785 [Planctomycetes bacterium]|nr:hypothetical protein [Planctomycetota bacterium]